MKKILSFVVIFLVVFSTFSMFRKVAASGQFQLVYVHVDDEVLADLNNNGEIWNDELIIEIGGVCAPTIVNITMLAVADSVLNLTMILQNLGDDAATFYLPHIVFTVTPSEYEGYVTHEEYFYEGTVRDGYPGQPGYVEPPILVNPNENVTVKEHLEVSQDCPGTVTVNLLIAFGVPCILGDIDRTGRVDISDVLIAAMAFGSYPGHPRWDSRADLFKDGLIDIFDLVIIGINFGKTASP